MAFPACPQDFVGWPDSFSIPEWMQLAGICFPVLSRGRRDTDAGCVYHTSVCGSRPQELAKDDSQFLQTSEPHEVPTLRVAQMRYIVFLLTAIALVLPGPLTAAELSNVVIILADDLGYGDLGC